MSRRAKGEGSLYQAKDRKWIYQYMENGRRRTKRFHRKSDALAFIRALAATSQTVPDPPTVPGPIGATAKSVVPARMETPDTEPHDEDGEAVKERSQTPEHPPSTAEIPVVSKEEIPVPMPPEPPVYMVRTPVQTAGAMEVITLGEWMDRWLEVYVRDNVKNSTYCSYELYIRAHVKPLIGNLYLSTIRVDNLQGFFNDRRKNGNLKTGEGLSPKTLANMRNMMHAAFKQAVRNRLISDNLMEGVRIPRIEKKEMRVLNREEQDRLITAARLMPEPAAFGIIFDLFTGLRLGEICGLRWENVDMEGKTILVCETRNRLPNYDPNIAATTSVMTVMTTKTDNSRRRVFLMDNLYQDLLKYKSIQDSIAAQYPGYNLDGYVFCQENGHPYEPRTYQDLFKRCVRLAGIRDANFHGLRHTFATRLLEEGMDMVTLSRLLGHANPSITMDKYGHSLDEQKRASVEKLGGLYNGASAKYSR